MPKIVVNSCFGGFGLSSEAMNRLRQLKNEPDLYIHDLDRTDPCLVQVVEELGSKANDRASDLRIADVPDDVNWYIHDYDGVESIHEHHRHW